MAVDNITDAVANICKGIDGIANAYSDAPDSLISFPCAVVYPGKGNIDWPRNSHVRRVTHDLVLDVYFSKGTDTASSDRMAKSYIDTFINTFDQNITLQGTVTNSGLSDYTYGVLEYAGVQYVGIKFTLTALEISQVIYGG